HKYVPCLQGLARTRVSKSESSSYYFDTFGNSHEPGILWPGPPGHPGRLRQAGPVASRGDAGIRAVRRLRARRKAAGSAGRPGCRRAGFHCPAAARAPAGRAGSDHPRRRQRADVQRPGRLGLDRRRGRLDALDGAALGRQRAASACLVRHRDPASVHAAACAPSGLCRDRRQARLSACRHAAVGRLGVGVRGPGGDGCADGVASADTSVDRRRADSRGAAGRLQVHDLLRGAAPGRCTRRDRSRPWGMKPTLDDKRLQRDREAMTAEQQRAIAQEAFLYGYPAVEIYRTLYTQALDARSQNFKAPMNQIGHTAQVFTPRDTAFITPNSDTPYSFLWMDLRTEPLVLELPAIEDDRYYSIQLIDLYTHNVAYLGTRAPGNKGG